MSFHSYTTTFRLYVGFSMYFFIGKVFFLFTRQVMLLSVPAMEEIYRRSCELKGPEAAKPPSSSSSSSSSSDTSFVHPTRLINFCVGLKGRAETMAIGGPWSLKEDGPNPANDERVLIRTAIRTCQALTGIDLSPCTTW